MYEILLILLMMLIAIAAILIIPAYMTNRAIVKVVGIFREHEADDVWSARTAVELGIGPRQLIDRILDPRRDYKPMALRTLIKYGVVRQVGNDKLYLNENALADICHRTENRLKICPLDSRRI